jgi:hypothetical protein
MSGGSFNYLCHQEPEDLTNREQELEDMINELTKCGHEDAAKETYALLLEVRRFKVRAATIRNRMYKVWHAVEWWKSGDSLYGVVDDAMRRYRGEPDKND